MKKIIQILQKQTKKFQPPLIDIIVQEYGNKPFLILIGCLASLRAKDKVTVHVCRNLFKKAQTPQDLIKIDHRELEKIIFPIGFYKKRTKTLIDVSKHLIEKENGMVPKTIEKLLQIKGVGRKTANLVAGVAFGVPAICVDVHVHRISNRLGIIKTKNALETEKALEKIVPKKYWIKLNKLLVIWGQNVCLPRNPKCEVCGLKNLCKYNLAQRSGSGGLKSPRTWAGKS
jgi:endonuclease-3